MKKIIILCIASILCCSCFHYEKQEQHGIVVDVEYIPSHTSIQLVPVKVGQQLTITQPRQVYHPEYWKAHVHYNDTICVYQNFNYQVHPGDSISRTVSVKI